MRPNKPAIRKSAGAQRPPPLEATPGYVPRWVAAQAINDALTYGKPLSERFPGADAEGPPQTLDAHDRALARSIATVAMRRLGTIRKGARPLPRKGHAAQGGAARIDADRRGGANPVSGRFRLRRRRSRRARRARRSRKRALYARWPTPFCATWRAPRRRSSATPSRSTTFRLGSPRAGGRITARRPRSPSPPRIASRRRLI